jgi:hypothetical protein
MTRISAMLGPEYDGPADLPDHLNLYTAKRDLALARLNLAEEERDAEVAQVMKWELGMLDLVMAPAEGTSPYRGEYDRYAEFYGLNPDTAAYARDRATETGDVILKLHYLEYVSLRTPRSGLNWLEQQRQLLATHREYIEGCIAGAGDEAQFLGINVDDALNAIGRLMHQGGVIADRDAPRWAEWIVSLAERSRTFPEKDEREREQQRHRWVADYLQHLIGLPAKAIPEEVRARALILLTDAAAYYGSTSLNETFSILVSEVDASLRKYFGETGTHERMIRTQVQALEGRAELHRNTGNGLLTAHFYRETLKLVSQHRQYFSDQDVARLQLAEQQALGRAMENSEYAHIESRMSIPIDEMDFTAATAEATVANLVNETAALVSSRALLEKDAGDAGAETPFRSMIGRTVIGKGKVVGESHTVEENLALDVERRTVMLARLFGAAVAHTVATAAGSVGLSGDHLIAPLDPLELDSGTTALLRHGFDRFIAQDYISAAHIIVPHVEDALRQHLRSLGVDTTTFKRAAGRTDDATLGTLLSSSLPDGRRVREYLGEDLGLYFDALYASQTGLNLRHDFAHGLARPEHCAPETAGIALSLLYAMAARANQ